MTTNPYEGLSDEAREKCVERMTRTLTKKPRAHKTRLYINSLSGRAETPDELRAPRDMQEMHNLRITLLSAQSDLCAICGHPMHGKASLDHVIPHAILGHHGNGNYVAAHGDCNGDKTNDVPTGCEMVWLLAVNSKLGLHPQVF